MLLDLAYNVGVHKVIRFKKLRAGIASSDYPAIRMETLDTANVRGKTVKGIAVRRARMVNLSSEDEDIITFVQQDEDGTITYFGIDESVLKQYRRDRHPNSTPGIVEIS